MLIASEIDNIVQQLIHDPREIQHFRSGKKENPTVLLASDPELLIEEATFLAKTCTNATQADVKNIMDTLFYIHKWDIQPLETFKSLKPMLDIEHSAAELVQIMYLLLEMPVGSRYPKIQSLCNRPSITSQKIVESLSRYVKKCRYIVETVENHQLEEILRLCCDAWIADPVKQENDLKIMPLGQLQFLAQYVRCRKKDLDETDFSIAEAGDALKKSQQFGSLLYEIEQVIEALQRKKRTSDKNDFSPPLDPILQEIKNCHNDPIEMDKWKRAFSRKIVETIAEARYPAALHFVELLMTLLPDNEKNKGPVHKLLTMLLQASSPTIPLTILPEHMAQIVNDFMDHIKDVPLIYRERINQTRYPSSYAFSREYELMKQMAGRDQHVLDPVWQKQRYKEEKATFTGDPSVFPNFERWKSVRGFVPQTDVSDEEDDAQDSSNLSDQEIDKFALRTRIMQKLLAKTDNSDDTEFSATEVEKMKKARATRRGFS